MATLDDLMTEPRILAAVDELKHLVRERYPGARPGSRMSCLTFFFTGRPETMKPPGSAGQSPSGPLGALETL